jgi:NAD-reducing hydrogenase small subunit
VTQTNRGSKARLATVWLDGCSGCHMSLLDLDEVLLELAPRVEVVFGPLVDAQVFPAAVDVTLVEGAVSNDSDLRLAQTLRQNSRIVVALGDCAVTSNVPSLRNQISVRALLDRVYVDGADAAQGVPNVGLPALSPRVVPLHEVVSVDVHVPGCPPKPTAIGQVVLQLLSGKRPELFGLVRFG